MKEEVAWLQDKILRHASERTNTRYRGEGKSTDGTEESREGTAKKKTGGEGKLINHKERIELKEKPHITERKCYMDGQEGGIIPVAKATYVEQVPFVVNDVIAMGTVNPLAHRLSLIGLGGCRLGGWFGKELEREKRTRLLAPLF